MKSIGIFYGSTTGNTQNAAGEIAVALNVNTANVFDISNVSVDSLGKYEVLLLGSSTWGVGDLQDDWEAVLSSLESTDLSGRQVGVFGTGDSVSYSDSFCDAVGILAEAAEKAGAVIIGKLDDASDYSFDDSRAKTDDGLYGLLLDEDNEPEKSQGRIAAWTAKVKSDCGL